MKPSIDWSIYQEKGSAVQVVRFCTCLIVTVTQLRAPVLTLILLVAEMYMTEKQQGSQFPMMQQFCLQLDWLSFVSCLAELLIHHGFLWRVNIHAPEFSLV